MEKNKGKNEVYEISLKDIFAIFKRGLWIMLACAIVFGALAFGYSSLFIHKTYTSTVKLYVKTSNVGEGYQALSSFNFASNKVNTYIEMLDSNNFREKLSDNLDNKYTAVELKKMVSFSRSDDENTEVFSSTIKASSPTEAKVIADSVADIAPGIMSGLDDDTELKIVDNATIPTAPSSPNVMKNTLFAFAGGFVLALIFVFIREALDNKIKYNTELSEINGIPVLSAIPDFNGDRILLNLTPNKKPAQEESEGE
jgi:capsular polysaccharide biosynthesis protein